MSQTTTNPDPAKVREVANTCICFNLRRGARAVTQYFDALFQEHGLRATQFTLLGAIYLSEVNKRKVTISVLADTLVMDRTTLARNLKPLERDGLVEVEPGRDQRTRIITLTEDGRAKLAQVLALWEEGQAHFAETLGAANMLGLLQGIGVTVKAAQENGG
ncbi:MAG: MarR family winged helix-turn-helix transcriptional regulator [Caldilineaceae bacterium]